MERPSLESSESNDKLSLGSVPPQVSLAPIAQQCLRGLMRVWFDFERRLAKVPIVRRLEIGTFTREDHLALLRNLRPQVVEGARWIARCASSFDGGHSGIRSLVIRHAQEEHRDYEMLESDYESIGGEVEQLKTQPRNIGTEALHAYLMHQASQPNPVQLLGAMWIIEGLGDKMAKSWASRIEELSGCGPDGTRFVRYHGENDGEHLGKLYSLLDEVCVSAARADSILKTAKVVARLYALQLEEIDHV